MRSVLTLFILSLFVGRAYAQPETDTKAFSLQQAVSYALKNHLNMRVAEANIRDANWQVKEFTAIGLPQVNGGASYQYNIVIPKSVIPPFFPEQDFTQVQDVNGNLIGINSAIATPNGVFAGYSFAIPINLVKRIADDLVKYGEYRRAYLGVNVVTMDSKIAKENGL